MSLRIVIDTIRKEQKTKNITTSGQSQKPIRISYIVFGPETSSTFLLMSLLKARKLVGHVYVKSQETGRSYICKMPGNWEVMYM